MAALSWTNVAPRAQAATRGAISPGAVALVTGLVAGALYVRSASPAVGGGNSGEFQVMAHLLGIAHPPSYPLYLLLAKLASLLPLPGDVAWRINVLTAALGGVAVGLTALLGARLVPGPGALLGAAVGAFAVAAMPRLLTLAVEAEVFTLHLALVLAFWLALLAWRDGAARPDRGRRWLLLAALLAGLGLANHRTFLFFAAGGALTVLLSGRPRPGWRDLLLAGLMLGLGLLPYLYVLRGLVTPVAYFAPTDVRRLTRGEVWYVLQGNASGETGGGRIVLGLLRDPPLLLDRSRWLARHVSDQLGLAGGPVALVGLVGLGVIARRRPAWTAGAVAGAAGAALFGMAYGKYPDADRYLLPLHTLLALGLGTLAGTLASAADRALAGPTRGAVRPLRAAAGGAAGLLLAAYFALPLGALSGAVRFTRGGYVHHTVHNLSGVSPRAVVCSWWSSSWGWWYAQYVDGHRPDVRLVPKGPDECARDVVPAELGRHPVYLPGLTDRVRGGDFAYFPSRDLWLAVGPRVDPRALPDGALLKGPDDRIYVVQDGQRRWVPTLESFTSRGFSWDAVRLTPPYALQELPEGPPLP